MSNEFHGPPVDYEGLSLRAQEQIRRKFLPLCTEDEKQQVQTTLMPMVHFSPSSVSSPSSHVLVNARIDNCPRLLRWALTCFVFGMDKIEAAKKNGEYVRENREQLTRFQLERGPCIPLPKPRRSKITGQKRRASQSQSGDADDEDGQRRVKSKTSLTQSNLLDSETRKRVREAANESRLMERESANGSSEAELTNREANLIQREADLERNEIELTCRKSAFDSREAALDSREASVVQREADLERTSTRQTASDDYSADLGRSETAMIHRLEALKTKETELNNRIVFLETRSTELDNLEATMDTRATELNDREAAMDVRGSELNSREVVLEKRKTELNNLEAIMDTRATELNNREAAMDVRGSELNSREVVLETRNGELNKLEAAMDARSTELNIREAAMDIRDFNLQNRDTVLRSHEADLGHCQVVTNAPAADLAICGTALESHEIGDDGEAILENLETNLNNVEAGLGSNDDGITTSVLGASQPDEAHKREKSESNERSATPQAQTDPRFNDKYMEEYKKYYNRVMLDITILRGLGDAERTSIRDETFRDALMEEFKERTCSLADATKNAWRIFGSLYRSQDAIGRLLC
ncbi:hypothetical protein MY1884_003320 [Beauveria asiatica]